MAAYAVNTPLNDDQPDFEKIIYIGVVYYADVTARGLC